MFTRHAILCSTALSSLMIATSAVAQDRGPPAAEGTQLQELVVTARRTDENIQSTPVAVTAVTAEDMKQAQVRDVSDLTRAAPSVIMQTGNSGGGSAIAQIAIRGQAQNSPNTASDPAVGIYLDGVYIARPITSVLDLFDVDRTEVLRGPQGTLFGRNTTGGAFNIITKQPSDRFEGAIQGEIGNFDERRLQGAVNIPLVGEQLAVRLVGQYHDRSGYGNNVVTNTEAADLRDGVNFRGHVRFAPDGKPFNLTISTDYSRFTDAGQITRLVGANPRAAGGLPAAIFAFAGVNPNNYLQTSSNFYTAYTTGGRDPRHTVERNIARSDGIAATLVVELGDVTFKSISAFRESYAQTMTDLDGTPARLLDVTSTYNQKQFTQEVQLSGSTGRFDWIGGAFYFDESGRERSESESFGGAVGTPLAAFGLPVRSRNDGDVDSSSIAAYAQVNYHFTDKLRGTGGFRYTWDTREAVLHNLANRDLPASGANCLVATVVVGGCSEPLKAKFDYPAWTVGLDYQATDDIFFYVKTSGASMAGGWNLRQGSIPAFAPEDARDAEVGFKADFFDHRLRVNAAAFKIWQDKVQRIKNAFTANGTPTQFVQNAGEARLKGLELEVKAIPWTGMELNAALGLLDGEYKKGTFLDQQLVNGVFLTVDRSGEPVPQAPDTTFNVGATQTFPIGSGKVTLHADYTYIASRVLYADTPHPNQPAIVKADYQTANDLGVLGDYDILNARIAYEFGETGVEVAAWGRNLTKSKYNTSILNLYNSLGAAVVIAGTPRTYGLSVAYSW